MGGPDRPIVMSIVQYSDAIESGRMSALELVEKADELGVHGVELRRELWGDGMNEELPAVRQRIEALGRQITFATQGGDFDPDTFLRMNLNATGELFGCDYAVAFEVITI